MIDVIHGHNLNHWLDEIIIRGAETKLLLVSPYIRLHHRTADALKSLKSRPEVRVTVCFGKADGVYAKSFHPDALALLKELPNVRIVYEERLHAKFYGNDDASLLTSMNLYDFSIDNNIEVGVVADHTSRKGSDVAVQSWNYFVDVVDEAIEVYDRRPEFEKTFLGLGKDKYLGSHVHRDDFLEQPEVSKFTRPRKAVVNPTFESDVKPGKAASRPKPSKASPSAPTPPKASKASKQGKPKASTQEKPGATKPQPAAPKPLTGYCIRTGVEIPFNRNEPMAPKAFSSWVRFEDPDYPEKFCHFSGEPSDGQTSMAKPILKKNWKKAVKAWEEVTGNPVL